MAPRPEMGLEERGWKVVVACIAVLRARCGWGWGKTSRLARRKFSVSSASRVRLRFSYVEVDRTHVAVRYEDGEHTEGRGRGWQWGRDAGLHRTMKRIRAVGGAYMHREYAPHRHARCVTRPRLQVDR